MLISRLSCLAIATTLILSCGKKEKKVSDEDAENTLNQELKLGDQEVCNKQGKFYDNTTSKCHATIKHAAWACTRESLAKRLTERDPKKSVQETDAEQMNKLDSRIKEGYQIHQCGEKEDMGILVVMKKKEVIDSTVKIGTGIIEFEAPARPYVLFYEKSTSINVNACSAIGIWHILSETSQTKAKVEGPAFDTTINVKISDTSVTTAKLYSDKSCTVTASSLPIKAGDVMMNVYVLSTASGTSFELSASLKDALSADPVAKTSVRVK